MKNSKLVLAMVAALAVLNSCGPSKSDLLVKEWKATELVLGETKLSAEDLGGMTYSFKADSSFTYEESSASESGKWSLNKEGTVITLTYKGDNHVVTQNIAELTKDKLLVSFEDHGMKRTITMVPAQEEKK